MSFGDNSRRLSKNAGSRKVVALVTDAHGGFGGIAQYNRDVLDAMCRSERISEIFVLPRLGNPTAEQIPDKITYLLEGLGSLGNYVKGALRFALRARSVDLIYCAHINLIPGAIVECFVCAFRNVVRRREFYHRGLRDPTLGPAHRDIWPVAGPRVPAGF